MNKTDLKVNKFSSQLAEIMEFNIINYQGSSLNEKWENMRPNLVAWEYKNIIIPKPKPYQDGAILTGGIWKWKLTDTLIFGIEFKCASVFFYGELTVIGAISSAIKFDTGSPAVKVENLIFPLGIHISASTPDGNTMITGIESCGSDRVYFMGNTIINDCSYGVVCGGDNQIAPASLKFDKINIGFPKESGILVEGNSSYVSNIEFDIATIQLLQQPDKDAMLIIGNVNGSKIGRVFYITDVAKSGYTTNDANSVIHIAPKGTNRPSSIVIDWVFASNAKIGVLINDVFLTSLKSQEIVINYSHVNFSTTSYGVDIDYCDNARVYGIGLYNVVKVRSNATNTNLNIGNCYSSIDDAGTLTRLNGHLTITSLALNNVPNTANYKVGEIVSSITANGLNVWLKYQNTGTSANDFVRVDNQMFIPQITALPATSWNLRGKMFMIAGSGAVADKVYICVYNGSAYVWQQIY